MLVMIWPCVCAVDELVLFSLSKFDVLEACLISDGDVLVMFWRCTGDVLLIC